MQTLTFRVYPDIVVKFSIGFDWATALAAGQQGGGQVTVDEPARSAPSDDQRLGGGLRSIVDRYRGLYSSLVSDCIEALGHPPRALEPELRPFHADSLRVVVGPAFPCQVRKTTERVEIDKLLAFVDAVPAGSVCVVAPDEDVRGALWGGLMSTRVLARGGVGAIVNGGVRDLHQIHDLGFPVFAGYASPTDIRGRAEVTGFGAPVLCRGITIAPGELVIADASGIVIVPAGAELAVLELAEERLGREQATELELNAGHAAVDVYRRHDSF